jgi:type IX secretion system PorP/SprF family membrane protein
MAFVAQGQDVRFSQFYANPLNLAPSFAGSTQGPRFILNFRDQWPKVPGNYVTYSFSADHYFSNFNSGMGVYFFSDNAGGGKLVTTNIGYAYSYKVKVTRDFYFQPGISAYYYSQTYDNSVSFADEFFNGQFVGSSLEVLSEEKVQHADFAISVLGYLENYWFGLNVDHLMNVSPVLRDDTRYTDMKISAFGGVKYHLRKRVRDKKDEFFHTAFNYTYQSSVHQLDIGAYYNRNPLVLGVWYRGIPVGNKFYSADALIYLLGVKYKDFVFTYSYDMTIGKLISSTGGSHEISIVYALGQSGNIRPKKHKAIPCPEF